MAQPTDMDYMLLLIVILLTSASQILQKLGAARIAGATPTAGQWLGVLLRTEILLAVCCLVVGTAFWLVVLYRMDLSRAYPFLSLGTVAVVLASSRLLNESVGGRQWIGVLLICAGIALVAST